jgi:hypothetical protein
MQIEKLKVVMDSLNKFVITSERENGIKMQGINKTENDAYLMNQEGEILFLKK